jgi:hypothetical protein
MHSRNRLVNLITGCVYFLFFEKSKKITGSKITEITGSGLPSFLNFLRKMERPDPVGFKIKGAFSLKQIDY